MISVVNKSKYFWDLECLELAPEKKSTQAFLWGYQTMNN